MKTIEAIKIIYKEDLKHFCNKWRKLFEKIGYENVAVSIANAQVGVENELKYID